MIVKSTNLIRSDTVPYKLEPELEPKFNLRRVWFSTNGLIAFAWSSRNNKNRINWWEVENVQRSGRIKYQIVSICCSRLSPVSKHD